MPNAWAKCFIGRMEVHFTRVYPQKVLYKIVKQQPNWKKNNLLHRCENAFAQIFVLFILFGTMSKRVAKCISTVFEVHIAQWTRYAHISISEWISNACRVYLIMYTNLLTHDCPLTIVRPLAIVHRQMFTKIK